PWPEPPRPIVQRQWRLRDSPGLATAAPSGRAEPSPELPQPEVPRGAGGDAGGEAGFGVAFGPAGGGGGLAVGVAGGGALAGEDEIGRASWRDRGAEWAGVGASCGEAR